MLRHLDRRVTTCALWLRRPTDAQRAASIVRGSLTLHADVVVLCEVPVERLLSRAETACFALVGDLGALPLDEACDRVVAALAREGSDEHEKILAGMAATLTGRHAALVRAMERANMQPVIIEDLVDYGYDLGLQAVIERGMERAILELADARQLSVTDAERETILAQRDVETLRAWLRRMVTAASVAEAIA